MDHLSSHPLRIEDENQTLTAHDETFSSPVSLDTLLQRLQQYPSFADKDDINALTRHVYYRRSVEEHWAKLLPTAVLECCGPLYIKIKQTTSPPHSPLSDMEEAQVFESIVVTGFCNLANTKISLSTRSPVTVLIGPNSSGKSNIMRALWFWDLAHRRSLNGADTGIIKEKDLPFVIDPKHLFYDPLHQVFTVTMKGKHEDSTFSVEYQFCLLESDAIRWTKKTNSVDLIRQKELIICYLPAHSISSISMKEKYTGIPDMNTLMLSAGTYLRAICYVLRSKYPRTWQLIKSWMLTEFLIELQDVVLMSDMHLTLSYRHAGSKTALDISSQGAGFIRCLATAACVSLARCTLVLLDEPDANLEAVRQTSMLKWLVSHDSMIAKEVNNRAHARPRHFLVCSHSEYFVSRIGNDLAEMAGRR